MAHLHEIEESPAENAGSAGIWISLLCAVHCMALPVLAGILPAAGLQLLDSVWFEAGMILLGIALGSWNLYRGWRVHGKKRPVAVFLAAATLMLAGLCVENHELGHSMLITGSLSLAAAQYMSYRSLRRCACPVQHS